MPLRKVHELTFLWFGLPGPLLIRSNLATSVAKLTSHSEFTLRSLTFFHAPPKKGLPFFSCGATLSTTVPKTEPWRLPFLY